MKYNYNIKIVRVVDGDTVDVMIDLGFNIWIKNRIRLFGIDTPEIRTKDLEEKERGKGAKARLEELLSEEWDNDRVLTLTSHGVDKYGRCLGTLYGADNHNLNGEDELNLNELLISEGFATRYNKS